MNGRKVIIIPETQKNKGTGHLKRMSYLFNDLRNSFDVYIYENPKIGYFDKTVDEQNFFKNSVFIIDKPDVSVEFVNSLKGYKIGVDSGGTGRGNIDYLIDILPNTIPYKPHISNIGFLPSAFNPLEPKIPSGINGINKILITMGGQDPHKISYNLYKSKLIQKHFPKSQVDLLLGFDMSWAKDYNFDGFNLIPTKSSLDSKFIRGYDVVFLAFGITLFECLLSGVPVFIINHDEYNKTLSDNINIKSLGVKSPIEKNLTDNLQNKYYFINQFEIVKNTTVVSLSDYIKKLITNIS